MTGHRFVLLSLILLSSPATALLLSQFAAHVELHDIAGQTWQQVDATATADGLSREHRTQLGGHEGDRRSAISAPATGNLTKPSSPHRTKADISTAQRLVAVRSRASI